MSDDKKKIDVPGPDSPEPTDDALLKLKEDYRKASPKERLKKFKVDPVTKTLRRA